MHTIIQRVSETQFRIGTGIEKDDNEQSVSAMIAR